MTYLIGKDLPDAHAGDQFRRLITSREILQLPGAHNGLAAIQAKASGFRALYLSGAAISASMGIPDLGILTIDDVCFYIRQLQRASALPILVDGDTGYGEALNVMHMVRAFEDAGAAAVQIEDQMLPKKCGHLSDKRLVPAEEMARKIAAAVQARRHLYIIARTDAVATEGMAGAVERAKLYLRVGADAIFPEALTTKEAFVEFARQVHAPLLANMTEFGRTPMLTAKEFEAMGYAMVIWPVSSLRVSAHAQGRMYEALRENGSVAGVLQEMLTRQQLYELINYSKYESLDQSIVQSIVPAAL